MLSIAYDTFEHVLHSYVLDMLRCDAVITYFRKSVFPLPLYMSYITEPPYYGYMSYGITRDLPVNNVKPCCMAHLITSTKNYEMRFLMDKRGRSQS